MAAVRPSGLPFSPAGGTGVSGLLDIEGRSATQPAMKTAGWSACSGAGHRTRLRAGRGLLIAVSYARSLDGFALKGAMAYEIF
ncbi:hypothetical protein D7X33_10045 [Butyricicoccus sp. 1XD8-22]|nr:hypothetical protein D7X33_10045 [Butyricicoccus sp. 1XD8-22]